MDASIPGNADDLANEQTQVNNNLERDNPRGSFHGDPAHDELLKDLNEVLEHLYETSTELIGLYVDPASEHPLLHTCWGALEAIASVC
jgi:hypothetical protein